MACCMSDTVMTSIPTHGSFSLKEAALFGFGHRDERDFDGVLRMAFCVDGDLDTPAGVEVRQSGERLRLTIQGQAEPKAVKRQVARVLSCTPAAKEFLALGQRDEAIGRVQAAAPGLRPVLFYSPYEAAMWSILSARRSRAQAIPVRQRLAERDGTPFDRGEAGVGGARPIRAGEGRCAAGAAG